MRRLSRGGRAMKCAAIAPPTGPPNSRWALFSCRLSIDRLVGFTLPYCTASHRNPRMATIQEPMTDTLDEGQLLQAISALRKGDFSVRLPVEWTGLAGKIADAFNDVIELNERMADEHDRMSQVVGKEWKIS